MTTKGKIITWTSAILIVALAAFIYIKFYFVFGEGVKAGELNQLVYKGWVWKTYEGRLIQTGFKSGKNVELHYREYRGALPWRGMQRYVVDEIISVTPAATTTQIPIISGGESL